MSKNRDDYVARIHAEIDQLNSNIDALQAKTNDVKADALEKYVYAIDKLRHQSSLAVSKLADIRAATEES